MDFKEEWLFPGAVVSVDVETMQALVEEIHRLICLVGSIKLEQKPWVGLTDEELRQAYISVSGNEWCLGGMANAETFCESIEAKLKEKNT